MADTDRAAREKIDKLASDTALMLSVRTIAFTLPREQRIAIREKICDAIESLYGDKGLNPQRGHLALQRTLHAVEELFPSAPPDGARTPQASGED
jgi:hypothetical protein